MHARSGPLLLHRVQSKNCRKCKMQRHESQQVVLQCPRYSICTTNAKSYRFEDTFEWRVYNSNSLTISQITLEADYVKEHLSEQKHSLNSRYQRYIEALRNSDSDDEIPSRERYKSMMQSIHTNEVKDYMDTREDNKVLNYPATEISADEEKLPRKFRRILAQLRSGYSPHLRAYLKRTRVEDSDLCPDCKKEKHPTNHLFDCEANPTNLCVLSLWESPTEAANFLRLQDDDSTEAAFWAKAISNNNMEQNSIRRNGWNDSKRTRRVLKANTKTMNTKKTAADIQGQRSGK